MIACPNACLLPTDSPTPKGVSATNGPPQAFHLAPDVRNALQTPHVSVVLPQWLHECHRIGKRLPESDFAFNMASNGMGFFFNLGRLIVINNYFIVIYYCNF